MINSGFKAAFTALAGAGTLLGGVGSADATLIGTFAVDERNGPVSQSLNFDAATPNQGGNGALTQVSISLSTATVGGGDQATLTGGEGGTSTRGGLTADLSISDVAGSLFTGSTSVAQSSCTIAASTGCTGTLMTPSQPSFTTPVVITDAPTLADFVGGPVQLTALIGNYDVTPQGCTPRNATTPNCGGFDNITWSPTVTISYSYAAATDAVPEPGTIGILGLGGVALLAARRRRAGT